MGLPIVGGLSCGLVMAQVSRSEPWLPYASPHERAHQRAGHADTIHEPEGPPPTAGDDGPFLYTVHEILISAVWYDGVFN